MVIGIWSLIGVWLLVIGSLSGCSNVFSSNPQELARQSDAYYQKAVAALKAEIAKGAAVEELNLQLGKLYLARGDFENAAPCFLKSDTPEAAKLLGITYWRAGKFTEALEVLNRHKSPDPEYLYYLGLSQEKLNLFDPALASFKKISAGAFKEKAQARVELIEKGSRALNIKDVDPAVAKIISQSPPDSLYPQAGGLVLYCDENIEVTNDLKEISSVHFLVKILNQRGKESFSEAQIDYDSTFEKVELEYARTIKPDGTVVDVGTRHIRDVSKYLNFPLYSNARVQIISFPEVSEGACIEYKLKILRSQLINKKDFVMAYPLQSSEPVISAKFSVSVPEGRRLNFKELNARFNDFSARVNPQIEESAGRIFYRWKFENIPQIIPEANMPPSVTINPTFLLSTFSGWQDIYDWWWGLAKAKIATDPAISSKVKELTAGKPALQDKARAIYDFCARHIRYVAVEYGDAGYEPHPAADIFRNKYGDCKDQSVLLVTMLREAGIEAFPVIISTRDYYDADPNFASMLFNHVIAAASLDGKIIFLDPTAESCSFGDLPSPDQGRTVLACRQDGFALLKTPVFPARHNLLKQETVIKINADEGIAVKRSLESYGVYAQAQRYWLTYTQPQMIEEALREKIQEFSSSAKLIGYATGGVDTLNDPVTLSYDFSGSEYLTSAGPLRFFPQFAGVDSSLSAREKRRYDIDLGSADETVSLFEIDLPPGFVVEYIPQEVEQDCAWFYFKAYYERKGSRVIFTQDNIMKNSIVAVKDYPAFKQALEGLARLVKQRLVLRKLK